jgi:hypothetical protein
MANICATLPKRNFLISIPFTKEQAVFIIKIFWMILIGKPEDFVTLILKCFLESFIDVRVCIRVQRITPKDYLHE